MKSRRSVPISALIFRSVRIVPRLGLVRYQRDLSSMSSGSSSTPHSAQPASKPFPASSRSRSSEKTVPALTAVLGVPHMRICGFLESETV